MLLDNDTKNMYIDHSPSDCYSKLLLACNYYISSETSWQRGSKQVDRVFQRGYVLDIVGSLS